MPTSFPKSLDAFPNLSAYDGANLAQAIGNLNDAIEALQAKAGYYDDGITGRYIHRTVTIHSASCLTPTEVFSATEVGAGRTFFLLGYVAKVDGATDWATTATLKIQDTNGTPVDFATLDASKLDGNEVHGPWSDSATLEDAFAEGSGGTVGKGVQIAGDANGAGSDIKLSVWGLIK